MPTPHVVNMAGNKKDLDITQDELERITAAFKKEEFRKLFQEYAEEISDPENRKRYEEEIKMMEMERGMNAKFINPDPGYVLKTVVDGETKAFINICKNDIIDKPSSSKQVGENGRSGLQWSIPHSFAPPKDDIDKKGEKCRVFDVVFHPDTYRMAETNARFKQMLHDTAMDGIEKQFDVKLDRNNAHPIKMAYKGVVTATVVREKADTPAKPRDPDDPIAKFPYPYDDQTTAEKTEKRNEEIEKREKQKNEENKNRCDEDSDGVTTPKYTITHRSNVDYQQFVESPNLVKDNLPKELVVAIDLPLIKSAKSVDLDFFEKKMVLKTEKPAKYHLDLSLPYIVDDENGSAKFDKTKRKLTVTLPVVGSAAATQSDLMTQNEAAVTNGDEKCDVASDQNSTDEPSMQSSPLIEIISSTENGGPPQTVEENYNEKTESKAIWSDSEIDCKVPAPQISYVLPEYEFFQDNKGVTFIFAVKKVKSDTIIKKFPNNEDSSCHLKFASVGAGGFPMHYSFFVQFPSPYKIEIEKCEVDVAKQNVVLLMYKHRESRGDWEKFFAGLNETCLEERFFVTEESVCLELKELEQGTMPSLQNGTSSSSSPVLTVTDMNDNHTKIHVKGASDAEQGDARVSPRSNRPVSESSEDIQIIYDTESPRLHGILKQRTVSESSDISEPCGVSFSRENSLSYESPISESDENGEGRKKSVSFSEYVDRTMFKCNQSVSSLKASLKSKKKRQKQREARHQAKCENRRRRRSSGSEHSSDCDDTSSHASDSSATSPEADGNGHNGESTEAQNEVFESSTTSECSSAKEENKAEVAPTVLASRNNKTKKNKSKRNRKNKGGKKNGLASEGHEPLETSENGDHSGKKSCDSTDEQTDDSSSVSGGDASRLLSSTDSEAPLSSPEVQPTDKPAKDFDAKRAGDNAPRKPQVKLISEADADSDDGELDERTKNAKGDGEGEKSSSSSMLSWEDAPSADPANKTQCAFEFTNSVMYDLDEE